MTLLAAAPAHADEPAPPAAPDTKTNASSEIPGADPAPVPHLSSPDNLPPYTTETPDGSQDSDQLSYLKDVWHAVQQHEVTPSQALVLLAQRPMDADAPPPPGMPDGPQAPAPGPPPDAPAPPAEP